MGSSSSKDQIKTAIKEQKVINQPAKFSIKWNKEVLRQQSNSVCLISTKKGNGTGFLCKIPNPVLITDNHILNKDQIKPGNEIKICFTDEEDKKQYKTIKIDEKRTTYTIETLDKEEINITIIEIKPDEDDLLDKEFIEIDKDLMGENVKNFYEAKDCYLIYYEKGESLMTSIGSINEIEKKCESFSLYHTCYSNKDSFGGPIILFNNKVIGVNIKSSKSENLYKASLLQYPILDYLDKLEYKDLTNKNGIKMIYKINKEKEGMRILDGFRDKNKEKCKLIINKKLYDICNYINFRF